MAIANPIRSPAFVEVSAAPSGDSDLMGLRLPIQATGGMLLYGVTTAHSPLPLAPDSAPVPLRQCRTAPEDRFKAFKEYASRAEAAFALGILMPTVLALIGARMAAQKITFPPSSGE
jgi:hypothetical protein